MDHLSTAVCLCTNASRSAALPVPSNTTTGTGGTLVTYSRTRHGTPGPPSTTTHTTGTPWHSPDNTHTCTETHTNTHTHTHAHTCRHVNRHTHARTHAHRYIHMLGCRKLEVAFHAPTDICTIENEAEKPICSLKRMKQNFAYESCIHTHTLGVSLPP